MTPGELREQVWARLMREHVAVYPLPAKGHHPNFRGAAQAARLLADDLLGGLLVPGDTVLSYPDYVLRPLRRRLLEHGVNLVVPAKYGDGYRLLESREAKATQAATIAGAERVGKKVAALPPVKVVLLACVALDPEGHVLDKGYGFSPPETLRDLPLATLLHPLQLLEERLKTPWRVRVFATPEKVTNLAR